MLRMRPFSFMDIERTLDEMNRMLDAFQAPTGLRSMPRGAFPAVNIYATEDALNMHAELPGIEPKDVELTVQENTITLSGTRGGLQDDANYYRRERPVGGFTRTFTLSDKVNPDKVKAEYRDGVLKVHMPKAQASKPKTIKIQSA